MSFQEGSNIHVHIVHVHVHVDTCNNFCCSSVLIYNYNLLLIIAKNKDISNLNAKIVGLDIKMSDLQKENNRLRDQCLQYRSVVENNRYSGISVNGPSENGTTSLQRTKQLAPKCPFLGGSTV